MRISAATKSKLPQRAAGPGATDAGFALIEMLVAMLLLSLVGLTLARFQTFQLAGTASVALAAAARLEADNQVIDVLAAAQAPEGPQAGTSENFGRQWHWTVQPGPPPDPALTPDMVLVNVSVGMAAGGPALVSRTLLRPRSYGADAMTPDAGSPK